MTDSSNPAGAASDAASAYVAAMLELLGDRDPIQILGEQENAIGELVRGLAPRELGEREAEGKWSVLMTVQHLADSEIVYGWRLRMILAQDEPRIEATDQDLWAERLGYRDVVLDDALEQMCAGRRANLRLLGRFSREELEARGGFHMERGRESAWRLVELVAGHDLAHRRQIARIIGTVKGRLGRDAG